MSSSQITHRPGPLKQSNKKHKAWKNKGKTNNNKGKIDLKQQCHSKKHVLNKLQRKNQLNQMRKSKRDEVLRLKRLLNGLYSCPLLATILAVDDCFNPWDFLENLKQCDDDLAITKSSLGHHHFCSRSFKQRYTFLIPQKSDLHSVMDSLKVSQALILLHSSEACDAQTDTLLSVIISHALPTTFHVIQGLDRLNPKKKNEYRKSVLKNIESRFADAKLHPADTQQELKLLLRQISTQKQRPVAFRNNRFHMLVEEKKFVPHDDEPESGTLEVSGYVRGQNLNVNGLVHLPGWGSFQMQQLIIHAQDPHLDGKPYSDFALSTVVTADSKEQETLESEVVPDPMEGEQTWPTEEELKQAEADLQPKKTVRKVPAGVSDYQASWIFDDDSDEESTDEDEESNEQAMEQDDEEEEEMVQNDTESMVDVQDENYDENLDMDEEKKTLVRFKEERMHQMFPDEVDTPLDISARVRFQKYRGLKNFKTAPWDPMENLPADYARIYRFNNFLQTKKKVLSSEKEGVEPGQYVTIHITNVPHSVYKTTRPLVLFGLLPHEQKMSVMNAVLRKHVDCQASIKSKDRLIFHIGFRRFTCQPIFSEHKTANKFKYERFLPADTAAVASFYAPVTFPPAPVIVFRQTSDDAFDLVAVGSVLNVDPNRIVVKRTVLSGHPFRVFPRSAVVRYMFFNKEDINWFKVVELRTKCGRRGHIRDSLGSHGHMKCVFDEQLQSQDVILMNLYKRVFPKWTYDNFVDK